MKKNRRSDSMMIVAACIVFLALSFSNSHGEVLHMCSFDNAQQPWSGFHPDNGVWEVGESTTGPLNSYSPPNCAGTVLDGDYPAHTDSRLVSPGFMLPEVTPFEELRLRFRYWCSYSSHDAGYVQISYYDDQTEVWSNWENVPGATPITSVYPDEWLLRDVDLTPYEGMEVKIAFYHTAGRNGWGDPSESTGLYIDDVQVLKKASVVTGNVNYNFEADWEDWTADDNVWEIGEPAAGPQAAHSPINCAGTVLEGNYYGYRDSRLISPTILLPDIVTGETVTLNFWQWWSYSSEDFGYVQISYYDDQTEAWSEWENLFDPIAGQSPVWTPSPEVDLTSYAGLKVRVAFYHTAGRNGWGDPSESTGWYIDDVKIEYSGEPCSSFHLDIKANGNRRFLMTHDNESVDITVSLDPGCDSGVVCEWWIGALTPEGAFWYDSSQKWVRSNSPLSFGTHPLVSLANRRLLTRELQPGPYMFFIALDLNKDGVFDVSRGDYVNVISR